ncbi:hypothetical protein [Archangium primigenium]|uniref:hypothetical protein n=1 Tax=[Archangium] primigenium TaxID=2792470 RepID=UPI003084248B
MRTRKTPRLSTALLTGVLLSACATGPSRSGRTPRRGFRLDTETAAHLRHANALGTTTSLSSASVRATATVTRLAPLLLVFLRSDEQADALQQRLIDCARQADQRINAEHFGDREPTREECGEELSLDGCDEPITRAMHLGRQKHAFALACAREVLERLWPAPFSIEQRYRYYRNAAFLETISQEQERRLIEQGCTRELWRTIKPDVVLHPDANRLKAVLILDFKFPCPSTNTPSWKHYGKTSAYDGLTQGEVYQEALGGEALLLSPRGLIR